MNYLPENRFFKALLIGSTVAVLICYAWLTAHLLEPGFAPPSTVVSDVFVRTTDSRLFLFEDQFRAFPLETSRMNAELSELEPLLNWLGALKRRVEIVIDEKSPDRLLITDTRIEIGRNVLLAQGQITKAILKSWILQTSSTDVTSSHLRTEVASDVLLAMLKGGFDLEVPGRLEPLAFDTTDKAWWTYADSYNGVCASAWKSLELLSLCENKVLKGDLSNVSTLSFRAFLGGRIWKSYRTTTLAERLPFVRRWVEALKKPRGLAKSSLKDGWLAVVQGELEVLLPASMDPLLKERQAWSSKIDAPLIVIDTDGRVSAPGTLKISTNELQFDHARLAVMTVCASPSLKDVLDLPVSVDRVVWRPDCKERKTDFVQVRPSAIRIALNRGFAKSSDKLDSFVRHYRERASNDMQNHVLGIATAKWDEQASAFQVHGALEAVEAFRLKTN